MLYQLLFNTHYFLLHTSYIFIFLYFYINLYVYLYIFLRFSYSSLYGLLTVGSTIFSYGFLFATVCSLLQFPPLRSAPYDFLYVFLYGQLDGWLYTVFSFFSYYPYMFYYSLFILHINLHCILNTIFYYILYYTPF